MGAMNTVVQVIDTLELGGAEKMAVMIANALPVHACRSLLCVTRNLGPLLSSVDASVGVLLLQRKRRLSMIKLMRFVIWLREQEVDIVHAHGSSVFIACAAAVFVPVKVVFHDHEGNSEFIDARPSVLYRLVMPFLAGIIGVNDKLVNWARNNLAAGDTPIRYVRNFSLPVQIREHHSTVLPGEREHRIVHLANMRVQKDHLTMIKAFAILKEKTLLPVQLLLVGEEREHDAYARAVRKLVGELSLDDSVHFLGKNDAPHEILSRCTIGVLSSLSEGLPLALLEYGLSGCAAVCTDVGQCREVLEEGGAGVLVPPSDPERLADGILMMLADSDTRGRYARELQRRVSEEYSADTSIAQMVSLYDAVMDD